ncbi:nuclear transport factor 2 family protein [Pseudomonas aeruginosa]|uniref:nuclear transport factor 2 family protein n=1 Tax=Pseudomonas aeruginosa TaxID=287 RepID=UPI0015E3B757|nr:nuclear transport factor 2 family protein [Pseudomonas aeruginosa]MBA1286548.1 helix-turn-helix domain-containing protein [Pseudomonas aeruginosa]
MKFNEGRDGFLDGEIFHADSQSETTHAVVVSYHKAWHRRDVDAMLQLLDPTIEYNDFFQGRRVPQAELRDCLIASMPIDGDEIQIYSDRLRVDGDTAFLQYQITLRGGQGLVSFHACEALRVRNGLVVQINEYAILVNDQGSSTTLVPTRGSASRLGLSVRQLSQMARDIQQYFDQGRPFLDPDIDMTQVAVETGYTRNQISFFLNHVVGTSFYRHINHLRLRFLLDNLIEQADESNDEKRVAVLARKAGFRALSTFFRCFREETGMSPKAYLARQNKR